MTENESIQVVEEINCLAQDKASLHEFTEEGLVNEKSRPYLDAHWIDLSCIQENPDQPRKRFSEVKLLELCESIKERGILQPIRVRQCGSQYQIIAGERRFRAAKLAGLKEIPAIICESSDEEALADSIIENIQRVDLNAMDRADALCRLKVNLGSRSWEEVSKKVGLTKRHVLNLIGLRSLPEAIQNEIRGEILSEKHGRALRFCEDNPELFAKLHERIKVDNLTGDESLTLAHSLKCKNRVRREIRTAEKIVQKLTNLLTVMDFEIITNGDKMILQNLIKNIQRKFEDSLKKSNPRPY